MEKKNDCYLEYECADYLRNKKIDIFLSDLKKKYQVYGTLTGKIKIDENEKEAIRSIVGFSVYDSLKVLEFIDAINKTRFKGVDLLKMLEIYFNEKIYTNKEVKENSLKVLKNKLNSHLSLMEEYGLLDDYKEWLILQFDKKTSAYRILISQTDDILFINLLKGLALINENSAYLPIAVFASSVSDNPHYFDKDSEADRLLLSMLSYRYNYDIPSNSIERKQLLSLVNLSGDEIAGNVVLYQVNLFTESGIHKGANYTYKSGQPFVCSKANLEKVLFLKSNSKKVYIVENEMVFTYLQKEIKNNDIGLICTSGQLSSTAKEIIDLLIKGENNIYYSGDIDPEGLSIAYGLKKQCNLIHYWHMDQEAYLHGISKEILNERRLKILDRIIDDELDEVIEILRTNKRAAYQENILDLYLKDLLLNE